MSTDTPSVDALVERLTYRSDYDSREAATMLRDLAAERDALTTDAERYHWLVDWLVRHGLLHAERCQIEARTPVQDWWLLRRPAVINGDMPDGWGKTEDAAIDAARAIEAAHGIVGGK